MTAKTQDFEKIILEQEKKIKKLIAASMRMEKRLLAAEKRSARQTHELRNHTNALTAIKNMLSRRG